MLDTIEGQLCFLLGGFVLIPLMGMWLAIGGWGFIVIRKYWPNCPFYLFFIVPVFFGLTGWGAMHLFSSIIRLANAFSETNVFTIPLIVCGVALYYWAFISLTAIRMGKSTTFTLFGVTQTFQKTNMEDVLLVTMWLKYVIYSRLALWVYHPWFKGQTFQSIMGGNQSFKKS